MYYFSPLIATLTIDHSTYFLFAVGPKRIKKRKERKKLLFAVLSTIVINGQSLLLGFFLSSLCNES
jgi:hypothetical protein